MNKLFILSFLLFTVITWNPKPYSERWVPIDLADSTDKLLLQYYANNIRKI